jgi:methionine-rich copper-binding protein CopC
MKNIRSLMLAAVLCAVATTAALAHALLDHATPGVGATVTASPSELQLTFTQEIAPAFSDVEVTTADGVVIVAKKAAGSGNTLRLGLIQPLKPGVYTVSWRVTSIDTHRSSGKYKFTIAP